MIDLLGDFRVGKEVKKANWDPHPVGSTSTWMAQQGKPGKHSKILWPEKESQILKQQKPIYQGGFGGL